MPPGSPSGICPVCLLAPAKCGSDGDGINLDRPGSLIGPYKVLEHIGSGGFGEVYAAEQLSPIKRRVALKIIKLGMDTRQVVARFEAERQALALMEHPNIAKVFDAGATTAGRPFFAMELVRGTPIHRHCEDRKLTIDQRLKLFSSVCHAIQHAHQKGIIHRDIKPSNILVSDHDGQPTPKVIDFGIAKATQMDLTDKTIYTRVQQFVGTPVYMSPEQADTGGTDIDTRADVYSLGALLYELLTGAPPFDPKTLQDAENVELCRRIREVDPPKPSTKLSTADHAGRTTVAQCRQLDPRKLTSVLKGDLDRIVMKAMAKDRSRRYPAASALAEDVDRYLNNEPILATAPGVLYSIGKFAKRHRGTVIAGALVAASLVIGLGLTSWQAVRAGKAETSAQANAKYAQASERAARAAEQSMRSNLVRLYILKGRQSLENGDPWPALLWYRRAWQVDLDGTRPEESHRLRIAATLQRCPNLEGLCVHSGEWADARLSPTGAQLLTRSWEEPQAYLWNSETGELAVSPLKHEGAITQMAFDPKGDRIVTSSEDGKAKVWDADSGKLSGEPLSHPAAVRWSSFHPEEEKIVTACADGFVRIWGFTDLRAPESQFRLSTSATYSEFSRNGAFLVTVDATDTARVWKFPGLEAMGEVPHLMAPGNLTDKLVFAPSMSADQRFLLTATKRHAHTLNLITGERRDWKSPSTINRVKLNADGSRLLRVGRSTEARYSNLEDPSATLPLLHPREVQHGDISPDGRLLVTSSSRGLVHVWDSEDGSRIVPPFRHVNTLQRVELVRDGRHLLVASRDGTARLWNLSLEHGRAAPYDFGCGKTHLLPRRAVKNRTYEQRVRHDPTGERLILYREKDYATVVSRQTGKELLKIKHGQPIRRARFSPDGSRILICGESLVALVDSGDGTPVAEAFDVGAGIEKIRESADGSRVILVHDNGTASVWNTMSGDNLVTVVPEELHMTAEGSTNPVIIKNPIGAVEMSPNGKRIAVVESGLANWVHLIHIGTLEREAFRNSSGNVQAVVFDGSGDLVATASSSRIARVWDSATAKPLSPPLRQESFVRGVAFHPNSRMLATTSSGRASVWDWATGDLLVSDLRPPKGAFRAIWFSTDGEKLIASNRDGKAFQWTLPVFDLAEEHIDSFLALITGHRIDETEGLSILERGTFHEDPERFLKAWRAWRQGDTRH